MQKKDAFLRFYNISGHIVEIQSNSGEWIEEVDKHITISQYFGSKQADLVISLVEADMSEADRYISLPDERFKAAETILLLDRKIPFITYTDDENHIRWEDFSAYARMYIDYKNGKARAVRYRGTGIHPYYSSVLFVYNIINNLLSKFSFYEVHGSCAYVNGRGLLFTGNSGRGKSTSAYALLQKGFPILSDEKILLFEKDKQNYHGLSVSDIIKVSENAITNFFPDLFSLNPTYIMQDELIFKTGLVLENGWLESSKIDCLLVIEQTGEAESRVERINPTRVVGEFFPVTMKIHEKFNLPRKFEFLMDFLGHVECYKLYFGTDMEKYVKVIEDLVGLADR